MPIITLEPATTEPVTLEEVRAQCRIDGDITDENTLLQGLISTAREYCENHTGRHFAAKTLHYIGNWCANKIELTPNLKTVSFIQYRDHNNEQQSFPDTKYYVDSVSLVGAVIPLSTWPSTYPTHPQPVTIEFEVGDTDESGNSSCPYGVKQAILLLVAHWYENRSAVAFSGTSKEVEYSVSALLSPYRVLNV
ncbi:head-tail connector protein [Neptunomonas japonica]|uniref:Phage related protein n=1 Tax=Neptunomonas japonica JAMM 1380 TaxID=1441457 RepID=A0A7R6SW57_9GAMM|nr:head-tail connector protein [Neptunomonas japonica]BBB29372.1 phage related protein [Neptunomonas japonica JAMM 1380]